MSLAAKNLNHRKVNFKRISRDISVHLYTKRKLFTLLKHMYCEEEGKEEE